MPKLTREYLAGLKSDEQVKAVFKEYAKCKRNPKYCIETYFTVIGSSGERIPFILYPHQIDALSDYLKYSMNVTMKTRQMGFTTFTAAFILWMMIFNNNFIARIISKSQKDSGKFIKDIKGIVYEVVKNYPWLCNGLAVDNQLKFSLNNGSEVEGESTNTEAGRGGTYDLLVVDEVAFIDRRSPLMMTEIWSAASLTLTKRKGKAIMISTPKGTSGWYYNTYTNAQKLGFHIIDAHWIRHPEYSQGAYRWVPNSSNPAGGKLEILNPVWPSQIFDKDTGVFRKMNKATYPFILDGKTRSPWYDIESTKLGPQRTRCELDCSFMGTGGEVLDVELLRELQTYVDKNGMYTQPFEHINGIFKAYKEYFAPVPGRRYVLSADVATGDGSDFSTFTIIDVDLLRVVGTYKGQCIPDTFGKLIALVGKRFNNCVVIVENAGGGGTTLQTLKADSYPNIYYSILRKNDPSTGMKKRKIGLWPSEQVRWEGGDRLEELLRQKKLSFSCTDIMSELYTWIWDKDGKRRHAPEKHDDLLMALQHGVYYIYYVIKRADKNLNTFKNVFEVKKDGISYTVDGVNHNKENQVAFARGNNTFIPNKYKKYQQNSFNIDKESGMNLWHNRPSFFK